MVHKHKTDKLDFNEIKNCSVRDPYRNEKKSHQLGENICRTISDNVIQIYEELLKH